MIDLRHALRALRAAPGFTIAAILVLTLGIGATAAMFGVVDGVLLRPLPFHAPEQLVVVTSTSERDGPGFPPSVADFIDWRDGTRGRGVTGMVLARGEGLVLRGGEGASTVTTAHVSDGYFALLGVRPLMGRVFGPDEEGPAAPRSMVLSYRVWKEKLGGDRGVIGRTLDFAEGPYTVIGVLPPALAFPQWADAYAPLATLPARREALVNRAARVDNLVLARLAPGGTAASGTNAINAVARALAEQVPEDKGWTAAVQPLQQAIVGTNQQPLLVLLGAVLTVLLIACANVANLQLVRAASRRQELAVRAALGAPRWRLVRQLLVESALLSAVGAAAGLVLAAWLVALVRQAAAQALPRVPEIAIDGRVAAFAIAVAALTALLAGVIPAFAASRQAMAPTLREGTRGTGKGGRRPVRNVLVAAEIALALVLLIGAGVLLRSFAQLEAADPGFDAGHVLAVRMDPPKARYDSPEKLQALYDRLVARVAAVPGVRHVGFVNHMPLGAGAMGTRLEGPGQPVNPQATGAVYRTPDASYADALGVKVLRGRGFTPDDMRPTSTVVLVNETLARGRWGSADAAVGKAVTYFKQAQGRPDYNTPVVATVVGVVNDVAFQTIGQPAAAELWVPSAANTWRWGHLAVRTSGDPAAVASAVKRAIAAEDRDISIASAQPAMQMAASGIADRRLRTALLGAFAGAALLLAALGVYGVMAYAVAQRTHELGIRAALGATPAQVWRLVLGSGLRIAAAGVAAGLALAFVATRTLEGMVYGVTVRDGVSFATGSVVLGLVALAASWLPARRAMRMDPARVLRAE